MNQNWQFYLIGLLWISLEVQVIRKEVAEENSCPPTADFGFTEVANYGQRDGLGEMLISLGEH